MYMSNLRKYGVQVTPGVDLFNVRESWIQEETILNPRVIAVHGLHSMNRRSIHTAPTGLFIHAALKALQLQFPRSVIIMLHSGIKSSLYFTGGVPVVSCKVITSAPGIAPLEDRNWMSDAHLPGDLHATIIHHRLLPSASFNSDGSLCLWPALAAGFYGPLEQGRINVLVLGANRAEMPSKFLDYISCHPAVHGTAGVVSTRFKYVHETNRCPADVLTMWDDDKEVHPDPALGLRCGSILQQFRNVFPSQEIDACKKLISDASVCLDD